MQVQINLETFSQFQSFSDRFCNNPTEFVQSFVTNRLPFRRAFRIGAKLFCSSKTDQVVNFYTAQFQKSF